MEFFKNIGTIEILNDGGRFKVDVILDMDRNDISPQLELSVEEAQGFRRVHSIRSLGWTNGPVTDSWLKNSAKYILENYLETRNNN